MNRLLQFFNYLHLPEHLQAVSQPFCALAHDLENTLPENPEKTDALRNPWLQVACAVRAVLFVESK